MDMYDLDCSWKRFIRRKMGVWREEELDLPWLFFKRPVSCKSCDCNLVLRAEEILADAKVKLEST